MSCSLAEAKARTSEQEFRRFWCEYYAREPSIGDRLDAWFPQLIAGVINNIPFRDGPTVRVGDLDPDRWGDRGVRADRTRGRFRGAELADMYRAWAGG